MPRYEPPAIRLGQADVFTRAQAIAAGTSSERVSRAVRGGQWRVVVGSVLCTSDTILGPLALAWAAGLAAGRTSAASHDTAAAVWGLKGARAWPLHATAAPHQHRRISQLVVHLAACRPGDLTTHGGRLPITSLGRTVVDCLMAWEPERSRVLLTDAMRRRLVDVQGLGQLVHAASGRHGHAAAERAYREVCAGAWSDGEVRLHAQFRRARLGGWVANAPVHDDDGLIGYGDAVFPAQRLVVEADGRAYHDDPAAFQRDRARQNRMVLAGWTVLRFTWHDIARRPDHVIATVRAHLTRTARAG